MSSAAVESSCFTGGLSKQLEGGGQAEKLRLEGFRRVSHLLVVGNVVHDPSSLVRFRQCCPLGGPKFLRKHTLLA